MCSNFPHSPAVIDVLTDLSDGILMDTAAEALCIVSSIVRLTSWVIVLLTGEIIGFGINIVPEMSTIVAVVVLEVVVPVSCATDMRTGVIVDVLAGTVIAVLPGIGLDVVARVVASILAVAMTASNSIPRLAPSEEALLLGWEALSFCCTTAAWNRRSLQTRMPSCQV